MLRRIALTLASIILVGEANEYYELYGLLPSPTDPPLRFYTHGRIIVLHPRNAYTISRPCRTLLCSIIRSHVHRWH